MKIKILAIQSVFMFLCLSMMAQDRNETITYDPLFWHAQLNLKRDQQTQIQLINNKFFSNLRNSSCHVSGSGCKRWVNGMLQDRSKEIWSVLSVKQKRVLEKIMKHYDQKLQDERNSS